ncbi:MAG: hypothetical protein EOM37_11290 [Proteobacteria bacterium]|nr:hypothetical protein [Pseudomonadota bacterium]
MGGYGSGRSEWRAKAERALRLDIKSLKQQGGLRPGLSLTSRWTWNSGESSSITILTHENALELIYRVRNPGEDWQDRRQHIYLDHTECNYGGTRPWFICPQCSRRVGVLYSRGLFLCRHCSRVAYTSKSENLPDRMLRKANKIRDRLGADYGIQNLIRRPKGMHWDKFWRLREKVERLESRALVVRFKMLRSSFGDRYKELLDDWEV